MIRLCRTWIFPIVVLFVLIRTGTNLMGDFQLLHKLHGELLAGRIRFKS